jgi:hypothetical protein
MSENTYIFTVKICGIGDSVDEAWDNASEAIMEDGLEGYESAELEDSQLKADYLQPFTVILSFQDSEEGLTYRFPVEAIDKSSAVALARLELSEHEDMVGFDIDDVDEFIPIAVLKGHCEFV